MLVAPWIPTSCLDLDQVGLDLAPAHHVFTRALKVEAGLLQHGGGVDRAAVARLRPGGDMAARRAGPVLQMTAVVARVLQMTVVVVQMPLEVTFRGSFQKCLPCVLYKTLKICLTCISFEALWSASKGILLKALESALKVHFWRHN